MAGAASGAFQHHWCDAVKARTSVYSWDMVDRIQQIEQEIAEILATPLPPYPERHIPREALHALQTEKLTLEGYAGGDAREIDLAARRFAIDHVPQNLHSYPMSQRETRVMAVDPGYLERMRRGER